MILLAFALLAQQLPVQDFPPVDRPGADPMIAADLRSLCPAAAFADRDAALAAERTQGLAASTANAPDTWLTLGCTRAALSTMKGSSRSGPLMLAGDSWAQGAISTVLKVLELRPGDRRAADILSVFAMDESDVQALGKVVARLADAVKAGANGGPTLRACSELSLRVGRVDLTRRCAMAALAGGHDSTGHLLVLARLSAREHDSVNATEQFVKAAAAAHDTIAKLAVTWHLQWFLTPAERTVWASLGDGARGPWVRDRLISRDVRDGQPTGARMVEHFKRLEYADSSFRLHTAKVMGNSMMRGASAATVGTDPDFPDTWRDYARWQLVLDDRGATWMRFGAPEKRSYHEQSGVTMRNGVKVPGNSFEAWRYTLDGKPLVLTFAYEPFSGQVGPSRMVSGNIGDIYCGIDAWRCTLGARAQTRGGVTQELRMQVRQQDREYISEATTKDDNSPRGDKQIEVIARLHRLWEVNSGSPFAMVTYAIKAGDLATQKGSNGSKSALIDFNLRRWDGVSGALLDTVFARRVTLPDSTSKQSHLTGFVVTSATATLTSWSMVATQPDKRRGRTWDEATPPLDRGSLAISDLVLGQEGQGLTWNYHNIALLLAPLNAVDRKHPVSLYYQVRSDRALAVSHATVALYPVQNGAVTAEQPALQVGFDQALRAGINEFAPVLDVSRLAHGSYLLEVQLADDHGTVVTCRAVTLNVD